eukprot:3941994-Rhodomonas_salina.1
MCIRDSPLPPSLAVDFKLLLLSVYACPVLAYAIGLRPAYAMPSTRLAYAAIYVPSLAACYAMSCTDLPYAPTSLARSRSYTATSLQYAPLPPYARAMRCPVPT